MRKSKYETHVKPYLTVIAAWCRNGATDETIAKKLGVAYSTFRTYRNEYPELQKSMKYAKEHADLEVEAALYKRAVGYSYDEVTIEGGVETKRVTKEVVPDTTAQIFWLKNRKAGEWKDKQNMELSGSLERQKSKLDDLIGQLRGDDDG
ncbi:MAG: transposase [Emergencia sp.]|nr:transposase [Emergencia sp.]